jgi:DNA-binding transcriptional LysR family regulator
VDNLTGMAIFARVVEARSFTAAAAALDLSKSAVSKQVARLEDRLGARLLNRTTRRLSLTEVGAAFYERCARILAEVEDAELAVGRLQDAPRGTLRINAPMSFGQLHLAPAVADFLNGHPGLAIDLTLNDRIVDLVEEGYDVAIRISRLADSSLIARRLVPSRRVVCGSPAYFERHGVPRHPADLRRHNCLLYSYLPSAEEWRFIGPDGPAAVRVSGTLRANNGDALEAAMLTGLGVALQPTFIAGRDLQAGRLVAVMPDYVDESASVYAVYPHSRHLSAKVRAFIDFLAARFCPAPPWDAGFAFRRD